MIEAAPRPSIKKMSKAASPAALLAAEAEAKSAHDAFMSMEFAASSSGSRGSVASEAPAAPARGSKRPATSKLIAVGKRLHPDPRLAASGGADACSSETEPSSNPVDPDEDVYDWRTEGETLLELYAEEAQAEHVQEDDDAAAEAGSEDVEEQAEPEDGDDATEAGSETSLQGWEEPPRPNSAPSSAAPRPKPSMGPLCAGALANARIAALRSAPWRADNPYVAGPKAPPPKPSVAVVPSPRPMPPAKGVVVPPPKPCLPWAVVPPAKPWAAVVVPPPKGVVVPPPPKAKVIVPPKPMPQAKQRGERRGRNVVWHTAKHSAAKRGGAALDNFYAIHGKWPPH